MIKTFNVAVVGVGFGQHVHVPAWRSDARCRVAGICAGRPDRAAEAARRLGIPRAFGNWRELIEDGDIDAVSIATPPFVQPGIAIAAIELGKAVFCEKPVAATMADAQAIADASERFGVPSMVNFEIPESDPWRRARQLLDEGGIGKLQSMSVTWHLLTWANRKKLDHWKTRTDQGGGTVNNFVSHVCHYLEWLGGPIAKLNARLRRNVDDPRPGDTMVDLLVEFTDAAAASVSVNAAAGPGNTHRVTLHGSAGSIELLNETRDYVSGFQLSHGSHGDDGLSPVKVESGHLDHNADGRIAATARLMSRLMDWLEHGTPSEPNLKEGLRVQRLIDAARQSHENGGWINTTP